MYILTRSDGEDLRVDDVIWETALALAFAYGWVPAGTGCPTNAAWRSTPPAAGPRAWQDQDYFSRRSQHVRVEDAHELASAVLRGLLFRGRGDRAGDPAGQPASEVNERRRKLLRKVALFAGRGGFTID